MAEPKKIQLPIQIHPPPFWSPFANRRASMPVVRVQDWERKEPPAVVLRRPSVPPPALPSILKKPWSLDYVIAANEEYFDFRISTKFLKTGINTYDVEQHLDNIKKITENRLEDYCKTIRKYAAYRMKAEDGFNNNIYETPRVHFQRFRPPPATKYPNARFSAMPSIPWHVEPLELAKVANEKKRNLPMTVEEKTMLCAKIKKLPIDKLYRIQSIIIKREKVKNQFLLDLDDYQPGTLREMEAYISSLPKGGSNLREASF